MGLMKKKKAKKENSERWLLTYSDLITLLMILFVLLYAMGNVDQEKYDKLSTSLGSAMGGKKVIASTQGTERIIDTGLPHNSKEIDGNQEDSNEVGSELSTVDSSDIDESRLNEMEYLKDFIDRVLNNYYVDNKINSEIVKRGLQISFNDGIFFDSGDDVLKPDMKNALMEISVLLKQIDFYIRIEGYTDNVPVTNGKFTSNWQLSAMRAANVVEYLADAGQVDGERLSGIGYGEYKPKTSNDSKEGKAMNRRVDIIILNADENEEQQK